MGEAWRKTWQHGILPQLSDRQLAALKDALERNEVRLLQGQTTDPKPYQSSLDALCEGACPIGWMGWMGNGLATVYDVEKWFVEVGIECAELTNEPCAIRRFANWWDATPRAEAFAALLAEVTANLLDRRLCLAS